MKNKILLGGGILLLVFSCQKEVDKNISQNATVLKNEIEDHDSSIIVDSASITWMSHENDIPSSGVSVYDDMLHFQSFEDLRNIMNKMDLKTESALLDWSNSFSNFKSLLSFYDELSNDPQIDDYEVDQNRLLDYSLESVLNRDWEIRIEDSVYIYNNELKETAKYLVEDGIISGTPIKITSSNECNDLGTSDHEESNAMYPDWCDECKLDGVKKVIHVSPFRSKLFHTAIWYERNWLNNWKKRKIDKIATFKDFYYEVVYFIPPSPTNAVISGDVITAAAHSRSATVTYYKRTGFNVPPICVSDFERTHNWALNDANLSIYTPYFWENDVHVNQWPQF